MRKSEALYKTKTFLALKYKKKIFAGLNKILCFTTTVDMGFSLVLKN